MTIVRVRGVLSTTTQDKHGANYEGLRNTFRRVYTEEGAAALMSGVTPRVRKEGRRRRGRRDNRGSKHADVLNKQTNKTTRRAKQPDVRNKPTSQVIRRAKQSEGQTDLLLSCKSRQSRMKCARPQISPAIDRTATVAAKRSSSSLFHVCNMSTTAATSFTSVPFPLNACAACAACALYAKNLCVVCALHVLMYKVCAIRVVYALYAQCT